MIMAISTKDIANKMFKYNKITKLWVTGLAVATLAGQ